MSWKSSYYLICDERGTTRWPSRTKTWTNGGFIVKKAYKKRLTKSWGKIKEHLCGNSVVELKWSHFFQGSHQNSGPNPLLSKNPDEWKNQAIWAIEALLSSSEAVAITSVVRKDRVSDVAFVKKDESSRKKNYRVLDINVVWVGILGQFAIFLKQNDALGEVWFDQLGSQREQDARQEDWLKLRDTAWLPQFQENQKLLQRISSKIYFFNSKDEPLVQIADFISGVIWAASEGEEIFLLNSLQKYFPFGLNSYNLLHIE